MCGFAGFINLNGLAGERAARQPVLKQMLSRIAHRGPDDETLYDDGILALGFRRLSIVDVEGGQQPFHDQDQDVLAVVNGEIYNHLELRKKLEGSYRFKSRSDSEVVLPLYRDHGLGMMDEVNGIFAVAVWDVRRRRLVLARDRLGVKPLYYAIVGDLLLFASELKALLAHPACPREMNWQQIRLGNVLRQPVTPSFIQGVDHLPAGNLLVFEPGKPARLSRYWAINDHFAEPGAPARHSPEYYIDRYGELLDDSVTKQLMSDVPLGIFLSGGIDSSLITAAANRHQRGIQCFTVAEQTTAMTGDLGQARWVAQTLKLPLHQVKYNGPAMLDELQFDLQYLEYMIWCADSPRFPVEWFYKHELYRYAKTHFPELKVILSGNGADEFAGGYSTMHTVPGEDWNDYVDKRLQVFSSGFRGRDQQLTKPDALARDRATRRGYQHNMHMNLMSLQIYNLWFEDRMSAAHGIEARVPFLDHRLVELLVSVPPQFFEKLFWDKHIVRAQIGRLLPGYAEDFPKVPFIYVPGNKSVEALRTSALTRTYPEFVDKYAHSQDLPMTRPKLDELYRQATSGARNAARAERQILKIMQAMIFQRLCQDGWNSPPAIPASSPLETRRQL